MIKALTLMPVSLACQVAGAAPVPSAEEVTASLTAAHAAVAAVDVGAADALWNVLTNVVALLDRARRERLGIASAVNRLQVRHRLCVGGLAAEAVAGSLSGVLGCCGAR